MGLFFSPFSCTNLAIGVSGMPAILDLRGTTDMQGRVLEVTEVAVVDEVASAADLVMGKSSGVPAVIVRGLDWPAGECRTRGTRPIHRIVVRVWRWVIVAACVVSAYILLSFR